MRLCWKYLFVVILSFTWFVAWNDIIIWSDLCVVMWMEYLFSLLTIRTVDIQHFSDNILQFIILLWSYLRSYVYRELFQQYFVCSCLCFVSKVLSQLVVYFSDSIDYYSKLRLMFVVFGSLFIFDCLCYHFKNSCVILHINVTSNWMLDILCKWSIRVKN